MMLPHGLRQPAQRCQQTLFPQPREEALARARTSADEAHRWHERGWLSYDPAVREMIDDPEFCELVFVRNLARSGLPDEHVTVLLQELPSPRSYDPSRTVYSFAFGCVEVVPPPSRDEVSEFMDAHLANWLNGLALLGERERLEDVQVALAQAIVRCRSLHRVPEAE